MRIVRSVPTLRAARSWRIHDDDHSHDHDYGTDHIVAIRPDTIDTPSPQKRQRHEDAAVRRVHAAEVGRLKGRYDSVADEQDGSHDGEPDTATFAEPKPDEVTATDFEETGEKEEES